MPELWHELYSNPSNVHPSIYEKYKDTGAFIYPANNLGFCLVVFCILTIFAFAILFARRKFIGAEFGGSSNLNYVSSISFVSLWLIFVVIYSLQVHPLFLVSKSPQRRPEWRHLPWWGVS